jgi:hypothetical protein
MLKLVAARLATSCGTGASGRQVPSDSCRLVSRPVRRPLTIAMFSCRFGSSRLCW